MSNTGQTQSSTLGTGSGIPVQCFTTGSNSGGYTLSSIEAVVGATADTTQRATIRAELWSATSGGAPNAKLADLTAPLTVSAGTVSFAAPASTTLTASTTYCFVLYTVGNFSLAASVTQTSAEDSSGQAGWSIEDTYRFAQGSSVDYPTGTTVWRVSSSNTPMRIAVKGSEVLPTWGFQVGSVGTDPGQNPGPELIIELSEPAPQGGLEFTLTPLYGASGRCAGETPANAADIGSNPPTTLTVNAGSTTGRVRFPTADNDDYRAGRDECFAVQATPPAGWTLASSDRGTIAIKISPRGSISFGTARPIYDTTSDYTATVSEGVGTVNVPITVDHLPVTETTIAVNVLTSGTATEGSDFSIATKSVTFRPSDTSRTKNLSVTIANDATVESADETILLELGTSTPSGYLIVPTPHGGRATLTIQDNDTPGLFLTTGGQAVAISPDFDVNVEEGYTATVPRDATSVNVRATWTGTAIFAFARAGASRVTSPFGYSGDTATVNLDSGENTPVQVVIATNGGATQRVYTIEISREHPPAGMPTGLSATPGDGRLDLSWIAPTSGGTVTGYDVHYTSSTTVNANAAATGTTPEDATTAWVAVDRGTEAETPTAAQLITGLTNGTEYRVRVRAKNASGDSAWDRGTFTPQHPRAVQTLTVTSGDARLGLNWTTPASGTVTGYDVQYTSAAVGAVADDADASGTNPATAWAAVSGRTATDTTTTQAIPNLDNGETYRVRVRAKFGQDPAGPWQHGTGTPQSTDALLKSLIVEGSTDGTNFDVLPLTPDFDPTRNTTTYRVVVPDEVNHVRVTPTGNDPDHQTIVLNPGDANQKTVDSGEPIEVKVAVGTTESIVFGVSSATRSINLYSLIINRLPKPKDLTVTSGDGELKLEWVAAPEDVLMVTGYEVEYALARVNRVPDGRRAPSLSWNPVSRTPTDKTPTQTITVPDASVIYHVRVRARLQSEEYQTGPWVVADNRPPPSPSSPGSDTPSEDGTLTSDDPDDLKPSFGAASIPDQSYMERRRIEALTLPQATGGNAPLTYRLTPVDTIPAGLTLATATRVLSGTPTRPQAETRYRWTVTDADGDTASLSFTIEVEAAPVHDPQAWLTRFGRTVGQQMVEAIENRIDADRTPGFSGSFAGQALPTGTAGTDESGETSPIQPEIGRIPMIDRLRDWLSGDREAEAVTQSSTTALGMNQVITGTAFTLTGENDGGMSLGLWGRGARDSFSGREGGLTLDGDVTSFMLGTDWQRGNHLFGLMLARSQGSGSYTSANGRGEIESRLTSLVPYANWDVNDRVSVWGAFGIGQGDMTLTPEGEAGLTTDIAWRMAAAGADGALGRVNALGGADLRWTADALWTRTTSEAAAGLLASSGDTTRLRFGLDSSWTREMETGAVLTPSLQLAARHDGGDAETGFGLEIGGGLDWSDPALGLEIGLTGRRLVLHQQDGFEDWGVALTLGYDPTPDTRRGFSASVSRSLGGASSGGVDALLGPQTFPTANGTGADSGTWSAEMAYGVSRGRGVVASPYTRISGGGAGQARLGYRVEPDAAHAADMNLDLWVQPGTQDTGETAGGGLNWRW